jgi:predicted ATPase
MTAEIKPGRNWWVLTGPDHSGKTTLLGELAARGYFTVPEQASEVVAEYEAAGVPPQEMLADHVKLQREIFWRQVEAEAQHDPTELTFLDRGLPDTVGYFNWYGDWYGRGLTPDVRKALGTHRYRGVFFLDQLPLDTLASDYAHQEDSNFPATIGRYLLSGYNVCGFNPIEVPVMPVAKRADFIIEHVRGVGALLPDLSVPFHEV